MLQAGSRRGVPYHAKTGYRLQGPPPPLPRFFGPDAVDLLLGGDGPLDFRAEVWPSLAKEIAYGHYHELFHGHPERTWMPWEEFLTAFTPLAWYDPATAALVARAVPDPDDRIDFEALDRPFAGTSFASPDALRDALRRHIRDDLARRGDRAHSADLGAFYALLSVYGQLPRVAASGRLDATSLARDLDGWRHGFFSFLASGPPGHRLRELLALSDAGLLHFLGPDLRVEADEVSGRFLAHSPALVGAVTTATTLVEARLPRATLRRTDSPLLRDPARARGSDRRAALGADVDGPSERCGRRRLGPTASAPDRPRRAHQRAGGRGVRPPSLQLSRVPPERRGGASAARRGHAAGVGTSPGATAGRVVLTEW